MKTFTLEMLKSKEACIRQRFFFKKIFGSSVSFETVEEAQEIAVKYWSKFDWEWAAENFLSSAAFEEYLKVQSAAYKEYRKIQSAAYKEYRKIRSAACEDAPSLEEYFKTQSLAQEEYEKIEGPAHKEFKKNKATAFAKLWFEEN